ncbi:hypothetical protein [Agarilytica rhodophyticola]|uniref:hypothetical protein n=1 Tax=Agarilytica rhodophyticola TaxID=1737490 RepID=UPI000B344C4B|nr:hypothetical protein [Agarilytica rhodophyticola]
MYGRNEYSSFGNYGDKHSEFAEATSSASDETLDVAAQTLFKSLLNGLNFMKRESENNTLSKVLKEGSNINW